VTDQGNGKYVVQYTCPSDVKDELLLSVLLRGKHIDGSPFHIKIHKEVEGKYINQWGSHGTSGSGLNGPIGIVIDKNYVYVSDHCNDQIQIFDHEGSYVRKVGGKGAGKGEFAYPWGVAVDEQGCIYVSDHRNKRIQVFAKDGSFLRLWSTAGTCAGLAIHGGFIFASENTNHQIHVFTKGGTFVRKWGTNGEGDGQFQSPYALTVDDSHVYVADRDNHRIQSFTKEGEFVSKWGSYGVNEGQFNGPIGITHDNDFIYVADQNHFIHVFAKDGTFVRRWGGVQSEQDGTVLNAFGLAVDQGLLYVADYSNHRIQIFK